MPVEDPMQEARRHLEALRRNPNGARVIAASIRTMSRDLVATVLGMTSVDRNVASRSRDRAIRLASYMQVVLDEFDDERGVWKRTNGA